MSNLQGTLGLWIHHSAKALNHLHEIKGLGFDWIAAKVTDGLQAYEPATFKQLVRDAASMDLPVVCWSYVYPDNIIGQIHAIQNTLPSDCQHLVLDAEGEWENDSNAASKAANLA